MKQFFLLALLLCCFRLYACIEIVGIDNPFLFPSPHVPFIGSVSQDFSTESLALPRAHEDSIVIALDIDRAAPCNMSLWQKICVLVCDYTRWNNKNKKQKNVLKDLEEVIEQIHSIVQKK